MSEIIKNPRNGCALHGALQTVQEIEGAVPIVHANAGCGVINYLANKSASSGESRYSGFGIPGTTAQERHVIFGGASRLREQIKNTIKVVEGDLYVVLNSCESAMVGDDVDAMTREIVEQGEPVVNTLAAGFNGGIHFGYEHVLYDILKSIDGVKNSDKNTNPKLVNIFGIVPHKDLFWQGNIEEIGRIIESVGLKANVFFSVLGGVEDLVNAKNAALSIVFSRWGEAPARLLNEKYDVPFIIEESLPAGVTDEARLIENISKYIELDSETRDDFIKAEKKYESYYISRIRDDIFEYKLSKKAVVIGDEEQVIRYCKTFTEAFGVNVAAAVLTDVKKKDEEHEVDNIAVLSSLTESIHFTSDEKDIEDIIRHGKPELIIGSSLEKKAAAKNNAVLLELSYPIYNSSILNRKSAGVRGEIELIEKYISAIKKYKHVQKKELKNYINNVKGGTSWQEQSQGKSFLRHLNSTTESQTRGYTSALRQ